MRYLGLAFLIICFGTSPAMADNVLRAQELQISQEGDLNKTCADLSKEAVLMKEIIHTTQDIYDDAEFKQSGLKAVSAVGSFIIGTATGGLGFAAAGLLAGQNMESDAENAEDIQTIARERRSFMLGIYNAKGCYGPFEHALREPDKKHMLERLAELEKSDIRQTRYASQDTQYNK